MNPMKKIRNHDSETAWKEGAAKPDFPQLEESFETDVCVIGAGLTGILSAYLLAKEGYRVAILEKERLGDGVTGLTTAFLTASIDTDLSDLIRSFGPKEAAEIVRSHSEAIALIEKIAKEENISCEFERCSNYLFATSEKDFSIVEEEHDAALELGLDSVLAKEGSSLGFPNHGYMELRNQARFHPLEFLFGLARKVQSMGVRIFEESEALEIAKRDFGRSVKTKDHSIQAKWVISAAYSPFDQPGRLYFKKGMYKSFVIEAHTDWKIPEGTYEDTGNPYHYMRVDKKGDVYRLIMGGEDGREDLRPNETKAFNALVSFLEGIVPKESFTIRRKWDGPVLEPVDGLAFIGPVKEGEPVLYAFAFSGNGMTYAGISAMLLRDIILGRPNPCRWIYRASRLPHMKAFVRKGRDFTEELVRGVVKNAITGSKKPKKKLEESDGDAEKDDPAGESGRMGE